MWPNLQFLADLVTLTKEILNGKLHFVAVLVKGPAQELDDTSLTAEAQNSINFQDQIENFV